jgi:hypothetical protein
MRTVGAMGLRAVVWLLIVAVAYGTRTNHQQQVAV